MFERFCEALKREHPEMLQEALDSMKPAAKEEESKDNARFSFSFFADDDEC